MNEVNSLKRSFYGLGNDWWKQIIDGQYHRYGPLVFDKGAHKCHVEPGYLKGITEGSEYAVEVLSTNDLSVDIYKGIHKRACSHFNGADKSGTSGRDTIGVFRKDVSIQETVPLFKLGYKPDEVEVLQKFRYARAVASAILNPRYNFGVDPNHPLGDVPAAYNEWNESQWEDLGPKRDKFVTAFSNVCKRVDAINGVAEVHGVFLEKFSDAVVVHFRGVKDLEKSVPALFEEFNKKISAAETPKEKLICIADLYQKLEWKHAPRDGTTRTDLIVLNALLCKYELNPAILDEPCFAVFHTLGEWVDYLEQGMAAWRAEKEKLA